MMRITDRANEITLLDGVVCFFDQQVSILLTVSYSRSSGRDLSRPVHQALNSWRLVI